MLLLTVLAATILPLGPFESVAARNGAHVVIRYGSVHRVSVSVSDPRCAPEVSLREGQLLVDNVRHCPSGERAQIELVTPHLSAVSVAHGGNLQTLGTFPPQADIEAAVEQGGTVDIRSVPADRVAASVYSGGRIFTSVRMKLQAAVESGGNVTYWGEARDVRRSVRHGGVVERGEAEDAGKPLPELANDPAPVPPIPPIPPIPPLPPRS